MYNNHRLINILITRSYKMADIKNIDEIVEYFEILERDSSEHTVRSYKIALNSLVDFVNANSITDLTALTSKDMREFQTHLLGKGLARSSVNARMRPIHAFYEFLLDADIVEKNPCSKVKRLKEGERLPNFISESEWVAIMNACDNIQDKFAMVFMRYTGLRRSEVVNVKVSDIVDNEYIRVIGKGDREELVGPLPDMVMEMMEKYLETHRGEYLISSKIDGTKITPETLRLKVKTIIKKAGLPEDRISAISCHSFRHTFVSNMVAEGNGMSSVQKNARHKSAHTTERYTHVVDQAARRAFKNQNVVI